MPPKKKASAVVDPTPPAPRRSARTSLNKTTDTAATVSTVTTKPTPKKESSDMGSAVSKAKSLKGKKSRKSAGSSVDGGDAVSSKIEDLTVDESMTTVPASNGKVKRKPATTADTTKSANSKKARLSKSNDEEEQVTPIATVVAPKPTRASGSKKQPKSAEDWYDVYASEEDPSQIEISGIIKLLDDLNVKIESAAIYILCWKLELPAMGSIPKKKWIDGMNKYGLKNNPQLLKQLATWLQETKPTTPPSDSFLAFFKYMFQFSKATPETRSVQLESVIAVMTFVLDPLTYDLKYDPATAVPLGSDVHPYPHTPPFLEFLTEKQPVKVVNKDQWESFVPFNKAVDYNLGNYNPEGAWPGLYDQYVDWRKERNNLEVGPKDGPDTES
ncbi:hypothetical protein AA313_de0209343 [Arthrobotrys entomopaga]|nr:hypothetical protein AA313_de0209343 [Arthrobotrys entomopaga]